MDKIFHVFVSSTYSDLIEERKKVSEAVAKAGFVAEGMEIFPASSQKQMSFIERVIDRCDYYILILAGRYGSLAKDGLSYTEKEFRYAKSQGIPVLAFIRKDIESLPAERLDSEPERRELLATFVDSLKSDTLVDFWENPDELSTKALAALSQARVTDEGIGWIRGDAAASTDILSEINGLRKENAELRSRLAEFESRPSFEDINLAGLDENFNIHFEKKIGSDYTTRWVNGTAGLSWRAILAAIGPEYRKPSNISGISNSLLVAEVKKSAGLSQNTIITIDTADKERILMQMEALGLMTADVYELSSGQQAVLHQLTENGLASMLRENVVKSAEETDC